MDRHTEEVGKKIDTPSYLIPTLGSSTQKDTVPGEEDEVSDPHQHRCQADQSQHLTDSCGFTWLSTDSLNPHSSNHTQLSIVALDCFQSAFLYITNKLSEIEINKTMALIITSRITKYLGIDLT